MDKSKTVLLSTVANFDLYQKSSVLFPSGIQKFVIDGTNGMHGIHSIKYMMKKLKGKGIQWLIMADEDVIFSKPDAIFSIIDEMSAKNITFCGVRDGGVILHRKQNPYLINTFFSVLNFAEVEAIWNEKEMLKNQFITANEFNDDLTQLPYEHDVSSIYEPYYCFYLWLRRKGKQVLFLDSKMGDDEISNKVFYNNSEILCHTWYARSYTINEKHTKRINLILENSNLTNQVNKEAFETPIFFKSTTFALKQKIKKYYKKIARKLFK